MTPEYPSRPGRQGYQATSTELLSTVNHTSFKQLMSLVRFAEQSRIVLAGFKSRWNDSSWMRDQWGYLQRACLAAASGLSQGADYCRCGLSYFDRHGKYHLQTCKQDHVCPSCNLHRRVDPCVREYLPAFDRARYWYALTAGWQSSPRRAGLHWVTAQDAQGRATAHKHYRPFAGRADAPYTPRFSVDNSDVMYLMGELPFKFAEQLYQQRWFGGLYGVNEWDFAFVPSPDGSYCDHTALSHVHLFANTSRPLTFADGIEIQKLYQRTCMKAAGDEQLPAYPDLEIAPIVSQSALRSWINYQIKSMPIEQFYREGIRNGCKVSALNLEFHQTVWDAIQSVRSPRKYGNLFARNAEIYIGVRQYAKISNALYDYLTQKQAAGLALTAKESRQLEHHVLACAQHKQHRLETKRRREQLKLKRPELPTPVKTDAVPVPEP